ncbi:hypothetical protein D7248_16440, partial [Legionella pneumophila]|uniref:hypothetical protein n=1 Tax=Legionella pneumophila TaxID=446 RepID=UPI0010228E1F
MPDKKFEFKRDKILFVFFSNNFMYENKADFLGQIKKIKIFANSQETILPLPDDVPLDIPLMFLTKKDDFEIKFSKSRIDFVKLSPDSNFDLKEWVGKLNKIISSQLKHIGIVIYSSSSDNSDSDFSKIGKLFTSNGNDIFKVSTSDECFLRTLNLETLDFQERNFKINESLIIGTNKSKNQLS